MVKLDMDMMRTGLSNLGSAALQTLKHASPTLFTIGGIAAIVGGGILACIQTRKLDDKLEECKCDILDIKDEEVPADDAVAQKEHTQKLAKAYVKAGGELVKLYGGSVALGTAGIVSILAGKKIMDDRYAGAVSALGLSERIFAKYRANVVRELGEEKDKAFRYGIHEQTTEEIVLDKDGNPKCDKNGVVKTKTHKETVLDDLDPDEFNRIFDEVSSSEWTNNYEYNKNKLLLSKQYMTDRLRARGWLSMNDIYEALGFPATAKGQDYGYVVEKRGDDEKLPLIDFGMNKLHAGTGMTRFDTMDDDCNAILLTFDNVQYIKDKIWKCQKIF